MPIIISLPRQKSKKNPSVFSKLSRQEIQSMFLLSDIKQTRVYQEAKE
jgi:hypothetical protein